jgi:hypothetical protein
LQIFLLALFACAAIARPQDDLDTFNEELLERLGPVNVSDAKSNYYLVVASNFFEQLFF